jgi:hypothetical protein
MTVDLYITLYTIKLAAQGQKTLSDKFLNSQRIKFCGRNERSKDRRS